MQQLLLPRLPGPSPRPTPACKLLTFNCAPYSSSTHDAAAVAAVATIEAPFQLDSLDGALRFSDFFLHLGQQERDAAGGKEGRVM